MAVQPKYTMEDLEAFSALPENRDRIFELINGEIVELSPTQRHGFVTGILMGLLYIYLTENPIGWGFVEARYQLPGDKHNAYIPDLSFVREIEGREIVENGPAPYMPDFAVEVKSPDDNEDEMRRKAAYYLKHGTKIVWLIFPDKKQVEVHTDKGVQTFGIDDTLDGGDVLPGFKVAVKQIFKNK